MDDLVGVDGRIDLIGITSQLRSQVVHSTSSWVALPSGSVAVVEPELLPLDDPKLATCGELEPSRTPPWPAWNSGQFDQVAADRRYG